MIHNMTQKFPNATRELLNLLTESSIEEAEANIAAFLERFGCGCGQQVADTIASSSTFRNADILSVLHDTVKVGEVMTFYKDSEDDPHNGDEENDGDEEENTEEEVDAMHQAAAFTAEEIRGSIAYFDPQNDGESESDEDFDPFLAPKNASEEGNDGATAAHD